MTSADDRLTAAAGEIAPRRRLSRADREQQVLRVAHEQFARRGFAAVTMEDIALEVGVKKPLLYAYFGNKERLYEACMAPAGEALIAAVAAAVERASTPAEAVRLGVVAFFDFVDRDRDAWRVLFDETVPQSGEIAAVVASYRERLLEHGGAGHRRGDAAAPADRLARGDRGHLGHVDGRRRGARRAGGCAPTRCRHATPRTC